MSDRGAAGRPVERFRHTPFVCGHLGPDAGDHWSVLQSVAPVPVKVRSSSRLHAFAASGAPGLEHVPGQQAWVWGRHVHSDRSPTTWRDAAHELNLAGFWVGADEVRLHTNPLAHADVFVRELDGTTYFANRIDPLTRLGSTRLHTDWTGWAEHLAIGGMVHGRTPFEEIRRLDFSESRVLRAGRPTRSRDTAPWMHVDDATGTADDVLAAALEQMPEPGAQEPSALGLSGGWDSRFIAVLLDHRGVATPSAWTAHKDMGFLDDQVLARDVAAALGMAYQDGGPHAPGYYLKRREGVLRRFEHDVVLHTWLEPMSARLRRLRLPVWDGLHGDVLLRNASIAEDVLWAGPRAAQRETLWEWMGGRRVVGHTRALRQDVRRRFHDEARTSMIEGGRAFDGQASELIMRTLVTKGARILGASPRRLLAPETRILLPFASPGVVEAASRVPLVHKTGGDWYRGLIARLNPRVAALPSTNDRPEHLPAPGRPGQLRPRTRRSQAAAIVADPGVLAIFHPRAQDELRSGDGVRRHGLNMETLQWGEALASWRARYADRLVDDLPFSVNSQP